MRTTSTDVTRAKPMHSDVAFCSPRSEVAIIIKSTNAEVHDPFTFIPGTITQKQIEPELSFLLVTQFLDNWDEPICEAS